MSLVPTFSFSYSPGLASQIDSDTSFTGMHPLGHSADWARQICAEVEGALGNVVVATHHSLLNSQIMRTWPNY